MTIFLARIVKCQNRDFWSQDEGALESLFYEAQGKYLILSLTFLMCKNRYSIIFGL